MAADNAKDTLNGELLAVPVNDPKRSHVRPPHAMSNLLGPRIKPDISNP